MENESGLQELSHSGVTLEQRQAFSQAVYDELISSVLHMLERLDLTAQKADDSMAEDEVLGAGDRFQKNLKSRNEL